MAAQRHHPRPQVVAVSKIVSVLVVDDNMDTADSLCRFLKVGAGFDYYLAKPVDPFVIEALIQKGRPVQSGAS